MIHTCLGAMNLYTSENDTLYFWVQNVSFQGCNGRNLNMFPFGKREKTSTTATTKQFLGSKFQPFLFVRGQKVVGWQWGIEVTLRDNTQSKPPKSPILPDSYFPTSQVWNLSHWKHDFGLIPIIVVRWNIILKWTNRSKCHKINGWDLTTKKK